MEFHKFNKNYHFCQRESSLIYLITVCFVNILLTFFVNIFISNITNIQKQNLAISSLFIFLPSPKATFTSFNKYILTFYFFFVLDYVFSITQAQVVMSLLVSWVLQCLSRPCLLLCQKKCLCMHYGLVIFTAEKYCFIHLDRN